MNAEHSHDMSDHPRPPTPPEPHRSPLHAVGADRTLRLGSEIVTQHLEVADRMLSRMRGLLGRRSLASDQGLWITPCPSIHMMFMRFPIDAVFLDDDLTVVRVHSDVRPWGMARGGRHAKSVLELPAGKAVSCNISIGDRLTID